MKLEHERVIMSHMKYDTTSQDVKMVYYLVPKYMII